LAFSRDQIGPTPEQLARRLRGGNLRGDRDETSLGVLSDGCRAASPASRPARSWPRPAPSRGQGRSPYLSQRAFDLAHLECAPLLYRRLTVASSSCCVCTCQWR
jgi:hypothetical protein